MDATDTIHHPLVTTDALTTAKRWSHENPAFTYLMCQTRLLATYRALDHSNSVALLRPSERMKKVRELLVDQDCNEHYPELRTIAEEIEQREAAARYVIEVDPPSAIEDARKATDWVYRQNVSPIDSDAFWYARNHLRREMQAKVEDEISSAVMKGYGLHQKVRGMLDWSTRYKLWCKERQKGIILVGVIPIASMTGSLCWEAFNKRHTPATIVSAAILCAIGAWSDALGRCATRV